MQFYSLTKALKGLFDKSLNELPEALRDCIKSKVLPDLTHITSWDKLSPDDRLSATMLWDYLQEPATKWDKEYWGNFTQRMEKIKAEITEWAIVTTPTAFDLDKKETRLDELRRHLALLEHKRANAKVDHLFQDDLKPESSAISGRPDYIPYSNAFKLLADRLSATPAEIAAWVHMGPNEGGIPAYIDVNELKPPKRFYFDYCKGDGDYLTHLMSCWFLARDFTNFQPEERFVTGQQLIEYWSKQPGIQVEAFIMAKISEGCLSDYQPVMEGLQCCKCENSTSIETALFLWSDVELVDIRDFGNNPFDISKLNSNHYPANVLPYVIEEVKYFVEENLPLLRSSPLMQEETPSIQANLVKSKILKLEEIQSFLSTLNNCSLKKNASELLGDGTPQEDIHSPIVGSPEWRTQNARAAAIERHNRPGGSRDKHRLIREIWASGRYSSREECAEQECAALGIAFSTARNALKNIPKP